MNSAKLPRVKWRIGQVLTPRHFRALEESTAAEAFVHAGAAGLPTYGLSRLEWNAEAPKGGLLEISAVTWVTDSGHVLDVPGNATMRGPLNLEALKTPTVDVYLHAVRPEVDDEPAVMEPAPPRSIPRVSREVVLSGDLHVEGSEASVHIARMVRDTDKTWHRQPDCVPPLLSVGGTPYLDGAIADLRRGLAELDARLRFRFLDLHARHRSVRAVQRARIEARKLDVALSDIAKVGLHPYVVFAWLRSFWLELYLRGEAVPDDVIPATAVPAYDHDDLGVRFQAVFAGITERMRREPLAPPTETCPFRLIGNQLVADDIPEAALGAAELYVLVQKPSANALVSLDGVRLAAPDRLHRATQHSTGVELSRVYESNLVASFGPWCDFYLLRRSDSNAEWLAVKSQRAVAFYQQDRFRGVEASLYWCAARGHADV